MFIAVHMNCIMQNKVLLSGFIVSLWVIVYDLWAQNLIFVAPIPEQVRTTTMHFSEVYYTGCITNAGCDHRDLETFTGIVAAFTPSNRQ